MRRLAGRASREGTGAAAGGGGDGLAAAAAAGAHTQHTHSARAPTHTRAMVGECSRVRSPAHTTTRSSCAPPSAATESLPPRAPPVRTRPSPRPLPHSRPLASPCPLSLDDDERRGSPLGAPPHPLRAHPHHVRHHRVHVRARRGARTGRHRDTPPPPPPPPPHVSAVRWCASRAHSHADRTRPRRGSPPAPRPATGPRPRPPCVQRQPGGGADPRQWPEAPRVPRLRLGGRGPRVDRGPLRQGGQEDREWCARRVCVRCALARARTPPGGVAAAAALGCASSATPLPSHPASPLVPRARRSPLGLARRARWPTWRARARACP